MLKFHKMQSLGNDFVIIDAREQSDTMHLENIIPIIADRNLGVGCDQLIIIEKSDTSDCKMQIFNSNGSKSNACGNATRCVAEYIGKPQVTIEVADRVLHAEKVEDGKIKVNMGAYSLKSQDIPLSNEVTAPQVEVFGHHGFVVNIGNPHFVIFSDSVDTFPLADVGPRIENHYYFPDRVNVSVVQILNGSSITIRTWERGSGETQSCGTGACASGIVSHMFKGLGNNLHVKMLHGELDVMISENKVQLTGDAHTVFHGFFDPLYFRSQLK